MAAATVGPLTDGMQAEARAKLFAAGVLLPSSDQTALDTAIAAAVRKVVDDAGPATPPESTRQVAHRALDLLLDAVIRLAQFEESAAQARELSEAMNKGAGRKASLGGLLGSIAGAVGGGSPSAQRAEVRCFTELDWTALRSKVQTAARPLPAAHASSLTAWLQITEGKSQRIPDTDLLCISEIAIDDLRKLLTSIGQPTLQELEDPLKHRIGSGGAARTECIQAASAPGPSIVTSQPSPPITAGSAPATPVEARTGILGRARKLICPVYPFC